MQPTRDTISHYRFIRKLGHGGMGEVYLAEDIELKRMVALKLLKPESLSDEHSRKRLIREAQTAATLDHPNICAIYEVGRDQNQSFIAMQYIEGETLAQRTRRGRLGLNESVDLAVQIADALSEAHSRNVLHRDVKPANIMIAGRGRAKLMDFGLASLIQHELSESQAETATILTDPGVVLGTIPYMSPEQLKGEPLDARSDIFSFGTVLYEMITGCQPFSRQSKAETISTILTHDPPPLSSYAKDAPSELQRIVDKALDKNRERRYDNARALLIDLQSLKRYLEEESGSVGALPLASTNRADADVPVVETLAAAAAQVSVLTTQPALEETTSRCELLRRRYRRRWFAAIGILVFLLTPIAVVVYWPARVAAEIDSVAILPFENKSNDPNLEYLSDGIAEGLIINLSQLPGLKVMSQTSTFRYRSTDIDPKAIGRKLNVKAIVTGRITQLDDRLRISLELVDAADNREIWGGQYERKLKDISAVQAEVSQLISDKLRLRLTREEQQRVARRDTENPEAYRLYLQGRFHYNRLTEEGFKKSIDYYEQAIALDKRYALAYAAASQSYSTLASNYVQPAQVIDRARTYAYDALDLDPQLAEAHLAWGDIRYTYDWKFGDAESEFKETLRLSPGYASAYQEYGYLLQTLHRTEESILKTQRAVELDPLSLIANLNLAQAYYYAGKYEPAITATKNAIALEPTFAFAHINLARIYAEKDMHSEAMAELNQATISPLDTNAIAARAQVYAILGKAAEARNTVTALTRSQAYVRPYALASIYAALDDKNRAFDWLEKAVQERSSWILTLGVDPQFKRLRSDQRYKALAQQIGLPQ